MKSTRLSRTSANKSPSLAPVQNQCIDSLLKHPAFLKAVRGGLAEDAAIIAVNMAMEAMTQHVRRSPNSVGGAHASSMLSALIAVGDEVVLKPQTSGKGSPHNLAMVGTVTDNIVSKGSLKPTYRVKWSTGEETTEAFDNLKMTKKAPPGHEPLIRKRLIPMITPISGNIKEQVTELARQLLQFEESLDWEFVDAELFRRMRIAWRSQLSKATSLRHLEMCFRDFVKVLHVEPEMSEILTKVLDPASSEELKSLAEAQDQTAFVHLWVVLISELHAWLTACKTKGSQGKQSNMFQTFESMYDRHGSPGFSKADMAISSDDQTALRKMLQDEEEFLLAKGMELQTVLLEGNDELTQEHMHGVTYGLHGLGGSYGGMPRTRSGVLQALLPGYVGEDDMEGECSEATDFSGASGWAALQGGRDDDTTSGHGGALGPRHASTKSSAVPMEVV